MKSKKPAAHRRVSLESLGQSLRILRIRRWIHLIVGFWTLSMVPLAAKDHGTILLSLYTPFEKSLESTTPLQNQCLIKLQNQINSPNRNAASLLGSFSHPLFRPWSPPSMVASHHEPWPESLPLPQIFLNRLEYPHFHRDELLSILEAYLAWDAQNSTLVHRREKNDQGENKAIYHPQYGDLNVQFGSETQLLPGGFYGNVYIPAETGLSPENILSGVEIYGVQGELKTLKTLPEATVTSNVLLEGQSLYGPQGNLVTGSMADHGILVVSATNVQQHFRAGFYHGIMSLGSANLSSNNIRSGVEIFGVTGAANVMNSSGANFSADELLEGYSAFHQGQWVAGQLQHRVLDDQTTMMDRGVYPNSDLRNIDPDLNPENIRSGVEMFGIQGDSMVMYTGNAVAEPHHLLAGAKLWVKGQEVTGSLPKVSWNPDHAKLSTGVLDGIRLDEVDSDLSPDNLTSGTNLFGILGQSNLISSLSSANAMSNLLMEGFTAWSSQGMIVGTIRQLSLNANTHIFSSGNYGPTTLSEVETDLRSINIAAGTNLFGLLGSNTVTDTSNATAQANDILEGSIAWVGGNQILGASPRLSLQENSSIVLEGFYGGGQLSEIEPDLISDHLRAGVDIFGITGNSHIIDSSSGNATAAQLLGGAIAWSRGQELHGTLVPKVLSNANTMMAPGVYSVIDLSLVEPNLQAQNLRGGVEIFGITGDANIIDTSGGNALAQHLMSGNSLWVDGNLISGTLMRRQLSPHSTQVLAGVYASVNLVDVDSDLQSHHIRAGANIFGVLGDPMVVDTTSANALASQMIMGRVAWVKGLEVEGSLATLSLSADSPLIPSGLYENIDLQSIDPDLNSTHLRAGVELFGVSGDSNIVNTSSGNANSTLMVSGSKAWVNGVEITGSLSTVTFQDGSPLLPAGLVQGVDLKSVDSDLHSDHILSGSNIFGVVGSPSVVDSSSGNASNQHLLNGDSAWVDGAMITGTHPLRNLNPHISLQSGGVYTSANLMDVETDLKPEHLSGGTEIFGLSANLATIVNTSSGNATSDQLAIGRQAWVNGQLVSGSNVSLVGGNGQLDVGGNAFRIESLYCVVDLSAGPSASRYPVSFTDVEPDLVGSGNIKYKTDHLVLRRIPAGTFTMGSPADELGRAAAPTEKAHTVTLSRDVFMGTFELTQQQYLQVMGVFPSGSQTHTSTNTLPLADVSYEDLRGANGSGWDWPEDGHGADPTSFLGLLASKTGLSFDLPTSAQWSYAARAGVVGALNNGVQNVAGTGSVNDANLATLAWYQANAGGTLHEVGAKLPNAWGLYDVHGNVAEWCLDGYQADISTENLDPVGPISPTMRTLRGGDYSLDPQDLRLARRDSATPSSRTDRVGLRLCLPFTKP
jgi:formylglycine-generating enzyme required for sulfatase activity